MSQDFSQESAAALHPERNSFRVVLIEWARELGRTCAYDFSQPEYEEVFLRQQLHEVRDIVPRQEEAFAYLMKEVRRGFEECYGWSWCLRGHLTPLFERRATKEEIEATAAEFQGALPDCAVASLLGELRRLHWDSPNVVPFTQSKIRRRA